MSEMSLEEGKFYINRKGEKVGPVERDLIEVGTTSEWSDGRTTWRTDGREYNYYKYGSEYDLIEEWKEEPVTKFNVGDKVKVLRQNGVISTFFSSIDCVFEVVGVANAAGDKGYVVGGNGDSLTQIVHEDDLAPCTTQESPQEDDEWGPWVVDRQKFLSGSTMIVEYDNGVYIRHKTKKPVPKKQIEVGGSYVTKSGGMVYKCIYIDGGRAWMKSSNTGPAYVWTLDGESISLNSDYNIDFTLSPSDYDEVPL